MDLGGNHRLVTYGVIQSSGVSIRYLEDKMGCFGQQQGWGYAEALHRVIKEITAVECIYIRNIRCE